MAAEPAPQDLLQHGEVIGALHCLDSEVAVVRRLRAAILEDHHGPDRVLTLDIRDVVALDPNREGFERKPRLKIVEQRGRALRVVVELDPQLAHRFLGIGRRLLEELPLLAALRHVDGHGAAPSLAQPLLDQLAVGQRIRHENLFGNVGGVRVVLTDERIEDVGIGLVFAQADQVEVL